MSQSGYEAFAAKAIPVINNYGWVVNLRTDKKEKMDIFNKKNVKKLCAEVIKTQLERNDLRSEIRDLKSSLDFYKSIQFFLNIKKSEVV